jgi:hypothetical protein
MDNHMQLLETLHPIVQAPNQAGPPIHQMPWYSHTVTPTFMVNSPNKPRESPYLCPEVLQGYGNSFAMITIRGVSKKADSCMYAALYHFLSHTSGLAEPTKIFQDVDLVALRKVDCSHGWVFLQLI